MSWFKDARFGMFIHYGAYAVAGRGEWVLNREHIPYDEYIEKYVNNFKAENYNPREWAKLAKRAGMKYMVLTTKHHDGFCLFDTETTDFNSVKMGPHKDLVKEYVEAVRAEGLKVGFYYSPADWHHPDYPGAYYRDWPQKFDSEEKRLRMIEFYRAQLKELMTNYGKIDILWYDGCVPDYQWDGAETNKMVKEWQPDILISNRNGEPCDFYCSEQRIVAKPGAMWEACMTLDDNWGYHKGDTHYKTPFDVIKMLATVAKDCGNLLLNVGPKPSGDIPKFSRETLEAVGKWLDVNGEAIYGTEQSPFMWNCSSELTVKGNKVYIIMYHKVEEFCLYEIANKVNKVYRLSDKKEMEFTQEDGRLKIYGVKEAMNDELSTVFVCEIEGKPEALTEKTSFWIPG